MEKSDGNPDGTEAGTLSASQDIQPESDYLPGHSLIDAIMEHYTLLPDDGIHGEDLNYGKAMALKMGTKMVDDINPGILG